MEIKDVLKELESLKKRISELEALKKDNLQMFGRSYSLIGSTSSDFLIKTKGLVKVQWGSKFIDLIKDGKINVDADFIFTVKTKDKIGSKDGIYITDDGYIYLKVGTHQISLVGEVGNTYVSFVGEQETDSTSKYTALKNLGFIYPDLEALDETSLQNGIIYIESLKKLYTVLNGLLEEFTIAFPNPFTEQFIISKNDSNVGAILIKGSGKNNALAFDSFYIFTEDENAYLQADGEINILVGENNCIDITSLKTSINNIVESNTFLSKNADLNSGFKLYQDDKGSTLIIDNIVVRNSESSILTEVYPTWWSLKRNVITKVESVQDDDFGYILHLKYENEYKVGDYLYLYNELQDDSFTKVIKVPVLVGTLDTEDEIETEDEEADEEADDESEDENTIYVSLLSEEDIDTSTWIGKITFLVGSEEKALLLRLSEHNLDLIESRNVQEEQDLSSVQARMGLLNDLDIKERNNSEETDVDISGLGIFAALGFFNNAGYTTTSILSEMDNSTRFASTEWVRNVVHNLLPIGTIIAYHGEEIPNGWSICDGTNGTPNLLGKFLKADSVEGDGDKIELDGVEIIDETVPTTVKMNPTYYSLIFIMKIG